MSLHNTALWSNKILQEKTYIKSAVLVKHEESQPITMALKVLVTIFKLLVHLICTGCFLVLAYQSIVKYIDKPTSVSVQYMPITTQKVRIPIYLYI